MIQFLGLFLLVTIIALPSYAMEKPFFKKPSDHHKEQKAAHFLQKNKPVNFALDRVAAIDLNQDGIEEFIFQGSNCLERLCPHYILAFKDKTPIIIATFHTKKLLISYQKTYGIRDLILFNNPHNDFDQIIYAWDPFAYRYMIKAQ